MSAKITALIAEARELAESARDASSRRDGDADWSRYRRFIAEPGGPERLLQILDALEASVQAPEKITALIAEAQSAKGGRFYGPISDNPDALDLIARLAAALAPVTEETER